MSTPNLSPGDISVLIDHLLKSKDPATVGLRKILKNKKEAGDAYPLKPARYEEFYVAGKTKAQFSKDERIIIELEKQANDLRARVENYTSELPRRERLAYEKGMEEGFRKGEATAREKLQGEYDAKVNELRERITAFCSGLEISKKAVYDNAHNVLLDFCFELAKKIIQNEVSSNPGIVLSVIKKSLTYIADRERLVIRVAKDDMETVSGRKDFWMPVGEALGSITIEPDERLEKGGCIIESNSGVADARLGVQFSELQEIINKAWESMNAPEDKTSGEARESGP